MATAIDSPRGRSGQFEDFNITAIADLPEIDTQGATGQTIAQTTGTTGVLRVPLSTSDDDDVAAVSFGTLGPTAADGHLWMEARVRLSAITDNKYFIGFADSLATADETTFSTTTDSVTIDTISDGIGFVFDNDATTKVLWVVAGKTDNVTLGVPLSSAKNPVINTWYTFRVVVDNQGKFASFSINGSVVYEVASPTTLISTAAPLVAGVWNYEQGTAYNFDIDYLEWSGSRTA